MAKEVSTREEFDNKLAAEKGKLVVVYFYAPHCKICEMTMPKFEALIEEYQEVVFMKVNTDESEDLVNDYDVALTPSFGFFRNREVITWFHGGNTEKLIKLVETHK